MKERKKSPDKRIFHLFLGKPPRSPSIEPCMMLFSLLRKFYTRQPMRRIIR
ncbi:Hypothetical protein Minf_0994 [Methylacidiphilum infernorum V4]|uniref:Uncharacterized protein n=1 Tax=Methylacidiphilum infernorum (isolate V4) TaxID=481448 RepID=B3DUP6_METI4|nr:Hypothetical protein Minf_0994 [Methylacidiphilum infernorum V4]